MKMKASLSLTGLVLGAYVLGILVFSFAQVDKNSIGVLRALRNSEEYRFIDPGLHLFFPFTTRYETYSRSGTIKFHQYMLGNFVELKQIEVINVDGMKVVLNLTLDYEFTSESFKEALTRAGGYSPEPFVEHVCRRTLLNRMVNANSSSFRDACYNDFLYSASQEAKDHLARQGFNLTTLMFKPFEDRPAELREATEHELQRWSVVKIKSNGE